MTKDDWPEEVPKPKIYGNFRPRPHEKAALRAPKSWRKQRVGMSDAHLSLVRLLPCTVCPSRREIEAHHLKAAIGAKRERGVSLKATDQWAIPLCPMHHREIERLGSRREIRWFVDQGIEDVEELAKALWRASGDRENMHAVLDAHKARK